MAIDNEARRRNRRRDQDSRGEGDPMRYVTDDDRQIEVSGDELSPFFRVYPTDDYQRFPAPAATVALAAQQTFKASAGQLKRVDMLNTDVATRYLMIFDSGAAVANGDAPVWAPLPVPASGFGSISFDDQELLVTNNGIVVAISTTAATLTLAGSVGVFSGNYL